MKLLGFTIFRHAVAGAAKPLLAKSLGDIALVGSGVAMAAGSVVFAGYMLTQGDHGPEINGMQYLAVFGRPNGSSHPMIIDAPAPTRGAAAVPVASAAPTPAPAVAAATPIVAPTPVPVASLRVAGDGLDMAPTGSIGRGGANSLEAEGFRVLAVERGIAWLTNGSEIRVVKPGDVAPGVGRIASIEKRDGRWTLVDNSGAPILPSGAPARTVGPSPFARPMIFGSGN